MWEVRREVTGNLLQRGRPSGSAIENQKIHSAVVGEFRHVSARALFQPLGRQGRPEEIRLSEGRSCVAIWTRYRRFPSLNVARAHGIESQQDVNTVTPF